MKIGIIQSIAAISAGGGVRIQGLMWKESLELMGNDVVLIDMWNENNWDLYDVIIVIASGQMSGSLLQHLPKFKARVAYAPIIDPSVGRKEFRLRYGHKGIFHKLGKFIYRSHLYDNIENASVILARSEFEKSYIRYAFDIAEEKIKIVPLSYRIILPSKIPEKEKFCFHVSRLFASNKNVHRLILAAKKYNFRLVLAGTLMGEIEKNWLKKEIGNAENIVYAGVLSDEELQSYYMRAKVFALPSLVEGVGMVALEAAALGCEIVLTDTGAPKEYYNGMAKLVNPFSVDDIGKSIIETLHNDYSQPKLMSFIREQYSLNNCGKLLNEALK